MINKDDKLLEQVIIFLVLFVSAILVFTQYQFYRIAHSYWSYVSIILILVLIGAITFLFVSANPSSHEAIKHEQPKPWTFAEKFSWAVVALVAVLILFNQFQISQVGAMIGGSPTDGNFIKSIYKPLSLSGSGKGGVIIGPQLNSDGRTTHLVEWQTISETPAPSSDNVIATVAPTGTPFYITDGPGAEKVKGVTFDDPITSQKVWASLLGSSRFGTANAVQLTAEEQQRWQKLTSVFTCDFCCGGPNSVTTISHCGCAHSFAWQGMAKFFIKYYSQYTDEQILGEMTKWKALWYPKGMIQDYLVYTGQQSADTLNHGGSVGIRQQFANQASGGQNVQATSIDQLPSMVGGC